MYKFNGLCDLLAVYLLALHSLLNDSKLCHKNTFKIARFVLTLLQTIE